MASPRVMFPSGPSPIRASPVSRRRRCSAICLCWATNVARRRNPPVAAFPQPHGSVAPQLSFVWRMVSSIAAGTGVSVGVVVLVGLGVLVGVGVPVGPGIWRTADGDGTAADKAPMLELVLPQPTKKIPASSHRAVLLTTRFECTTQPSPTDLPRFHSHQAAPTKASPPRTPTLASNKSRTLDESAAV